MRQIGQFKDGSSALEPTTPEDFARMGKVIGAYAVRVPSEEEGTVKVKIGKLCQLNEVGGDLPKSESSKCSSTTVGYSAAYAAQYDAIFGKSKQQESTN